MDPETQRLFVISLVGLLLFFPVFNQVAATALDTLRDADHKAQLDGFFKNWEDIPDDRKLEYWDGRNPPPEHWEGGEPPDDFTYGGNGQNGNGNGNGQNGNGSGEEEEGEEEEEERFVYETQVLWTFPNEDYSLTSGSQNRTNLPQRDYHYVNVTYYYEGFSGEAEFILYVGEQVEWDHYIGENAPAVFENQPERHHRAQDIGPAPLVIYHDYDPIGFPQDFNVTITGTYPVSRG